MIEYLRGLCDDWKELRDYEKANILGAMILCAFYVFVFVGILAPASIWLWKGAMS